MLCLDANKNIYRAELGRQLTDLHGLGMWEVVGNFTGKQLGATFFRGSKPINAIWVTSDLKVAHACVMPVGHGVGNHRLFVVDFAMASMIGTCPPKIVRPALRRLNTKISGCVLWYNRALWRNILRHRLVEHMINVTNLHDSKEIILAKLNQLDREEEQYMQHVKKKCRRIKTNRIPFSPEALLWIRQCQVYHLLIRWHAGKIRNRGNLKRTARQCPIKTPSFCPWRRCNYGSKSAKQNVITSGNMGNGIANNTLPNVSKR